MAEYPIDVIAKAFLTYEPMTHKKVQKLCYYAQVWNYYFFNDKLSDTTFEAWVHGPVSRSLYSRFADFGWQDIPKDITFDFATLDPRAKNIIEEVYKVYGEYTGDELEHMTHRESPWNKARNNLPAYEPSTNEISLESMKVFCQEVLSRIQPNV